MQKAKEFNAMYILQKKKESVSYWHKVDNLNSIRRINMKF